MRDLDKPRQSHWQIERDGEKIASQREEDKERKDKEQARVSEKFKKREIN